MKTQNIKLIALLITLAAVMTGLSAEAQRREYKSDRHDRDGRYERSHRDNNDRGKRYEKNHRTYDDRKKYDKREYHKKSERYSKNRYDGHRDRNYQSHKYHKRHRDYKHYDRHYDNRRYQSNHSYRHPHYGTVYRKFYSSPMRLRHNDCNYYYHSGHYYRHHHGVGYVRVELPRRVVFERLPDRCERFSHRGHTYYRSGNIVFERYRNGYRMAPSLGIQLSAHF